MCAPLADLVGDDCRVFGGDARGIAGNERVRDGVVAGSQLRGIHAGLNQRMAVDLERGLLAAIGHVKREISESSQHFWPLDVSCGDAPGL